MSSSTNIPYSVKSMNGVIVLADGNGTEIRDGGIITNSVNTGDLNSSNNCEIDNVVIINGNTPSTNPNTGSLLLTSGGIGCVGNGNFTGNLTCNSLTASNVSIPSLTLTKLTVSGDISANNMYATITMKSKDMICSNADLGNCRTTTMMQCNRIDQYTSGVCKLWNNNGSANSIQIGSASNASINSYGVIHNKYGSTTNDYTTTQNRYGTTMVYGANSSSTHTINGNLTTTGSITCGTSILASTLTANTKVSAFNIESNTTGGANQIYSNIIAGGTISFGSINSANHYHGLTNIYGDDSTTSHLFKSGTYTFNDNLSGTGTLTINPKITLSKPLTSSSTVQCSNLTASTITTSGNITCGGTLSTSTFLPTSLAINTISALAPATACLLWGNTTDNLTIGSATTASLTIETPTNFNKNVVFVGNMLAQYGFSTHNWISNLTTGTMNLCTGLTSGTLNIGNPAFGGASSVVNIDGGTVNIDNIKSANAYFCRAQQSFRMFGTTCNAFGAGFNLVASYNSAGKYSVSFSDPMPNANYFVQVSGTYQAVGTAMGDIMIGSATDYTTAGFTLLLGKAFSSTLQGCLDNTGRVVISVFSA